MYTISQLASVFGISRSTLLYYERIGLLKAGKRNAAGYRLFSDEDKLRLEQVMVYRDIGVPLEKIKEYLDKPQEGVLPILLNRLIAINTDIDRLRSQQKYILEMIEAEGSLKGIKPVLEKHKALGKKAGITEGNYRNFHRMFEKASPKSHRKLLQYLGFSDIEITEFLENIKENP